MKKRNFILAILVLCITFLMGIYDIQAQNISENDYSKIKVDD